MKILILSSRFPYPIEKGDKLRLYHQIKELSENNEIFLVSLSTEKIEKKCIEEVEKFCKEVRVFRISKWISALRAIISILGNEPSQVSYFFRNKIRQKINEIAGKWNPDMVYCQLVRMAPYANTLQTKKVIDFMDAFSISFKRRSMHEGFLFKWFFTIESKKLKNYETEQLMLFDGATIISESDKLEIGTKNNRNHLQVISNGIETDYFSPIEQNKDYELLFVGNMGYHPNVIAAKYLTKRIIPKLDKSIKLLVAGARPTNEIKSFASPQVIISGWMEDIRDAYNSAIIFVAPIFSGAGQQNKILEAMAMEKICITTPLVNKAIGAEHGKHLFIASTETDFVDRINQILQNKKNFKHIGIEARKFVRTNFSWKTENRKLETLFSKLKNDNNQ